MFLTTDHALSCKKLRGRYARHDALRNAIRDMMVAAGYPVQTEVQISADDAKRMDLVVYLGTTQLWVDMSVLNTCAPSYLGKRNAPRDRERHKTSKYAREAKKASAQFIPAVISTYGELGNSFAALLKRIATKAMNTHPCALTREPEKWVAAYKLQLMHRIAAVLAYSNHLVLEEARLRTASIRFNSYCLYRGLKRYQGPVIEVY